MPGDVRELSVRLEELVARHREDGMRASMALPGNPDGMRIQSVPGAIAFAADRWPGSVELNHICVFGRPDLETIEELVRFYPAHPIRRLRVAEPVLDKATRQELERRGWRLAGVESRTCGTVCREPAEMPDSIVVRPVLTREDQDQYIELHMHASTGSPRRRDEPPGNGPEWESLRVFHCGPTRRLFLAEVEGVPAGHGALYPRAGLAYLGPAATVPAFRRRGVHTALLQARMHQAYLEGCELVACGLWNDNMDSLRNQERQGMAVAYRRFEYTLPAEGTPE